MALTLQIKRSTGSTAPSSLADGELAYTHGNEQFYIGDGSTVKVIGGKKFNDLIDHTAGTLTASSALIADSNSAVDSFIIGNNSSTGGSLKLNEGTANGTNHVALKAPNSITSNVTYTLPASPSAGDFLTTDGSGNLSWGTAVTSESVEDIVGDQLVTNGVHTRITATYDDAGDGAIDLVVDSDLANYSNTNTGFITASSTDTLTNKSGNISQWTNDSGYLTSFTETNDLSAAVTWANVPDANITQSSVTQHQASLSITESQISDLGSYLTAETNDLSAAVVWANVPNANITQGSVTQHQAALSITESQISDLQSYLTAETNDLSAAVTWANVPDANITESSVTQHEDALSITESQISDLQSYLTAETNDLSAAVVWANVPNANITQGSVTQHQAALSIATSQLTGTVTNAQLAGSITNAKLSNSSVTIGSDAVALGGTQTDLNGITSLDVDNMTLDANTISTTDSNGDLVLSPNGTGSVTVPSGYEARAGFSSDSLVNKSYVDSVANGLDVKASVRVATTANLAATYNNSAGTLTASSNGAISVDGVSLSVDDRVLVKDQTTQTQNGFYKVTTVGSGGAAFVLTRTPDADAADELTAGAFTFTEEGTANADNGFVLSTTGAVTLGTTNIVFEQFSGAGQIAAGNGLTKTGNTIDAVGTSNRISVSANAIDIASTYVGQNTITTLGTITTGTWTGTAIAATSGGTGLTSIAKGSVLVANSANTLSALDGGGSDDGYLFYTSSSDTLSFATSVDGGTF